MNVDDTAGDAYLKPQITYIDITCQKAVLAINRMDTNFKCFTVQIKNKKIKNAYPFALSFQHDP